MKFDYLSEGDVKYISKKIKLSLEKTSLLLEEEDDFFNVVFSMSGKTKIKIKEIKNLSSSFAFIKKLSETCSEEEINSDEKLYFFKKIVYFFIKIKSDQKIIKETDFKSLNPDRSFVSLLSLTIFRSGIPPKAEESLKLFEKDIDLNNIEGFKSGKDNLLKEIAKNYFLWKNRLNEVINE